MLKYWTRPPTAVTHKPKSKERKRKGSRDFPFRVGPLLAAGVSRASSAMWALSARPLVTLLFLTCSHVHRTWTCVSQHVRFLQRLSHSGFSSTSHCEQLPLSSPTPHTPSLSLSTLSFSLFAPPSFGRVASISANRERTRPPPPAFLVTVTGSFLSALG